MTRWMNGAAERRWLVIGPLVAALALAFSCSPAGNDSKVVNGSGASAATSAGGASSGGSSSTGNPSAGSKSLPSLGGDLNAPAEGGPCSGLECAVPTCPPGTTTSISGTVYAPNGTLPLYNVVVYVPNAEVEPLTDGASCDRCGASILNPVTAAVTDEAGKFKLEKAPAGPDIPLVIQVGKWRRQVKVPVVAQCVDTPLGPEMTRLPKNKTEGDLPRIAISAGGADAMECLPRRLGIDDAEFTTNAGEGRIHLYTATDAGADLTVKAFAPTLNGGAMLPHSMTLWNNVENMMKYDIVVLSCEGAALAMEKPMASRQALYDYASRGGRVFASHWAHVWFADGPAPLPTTGEWNNRQNPVESGTLPATINQDFPKGEALAKWLVNVGASTVQGTFDITMPRDNIQEVNPTVAREWITVNNPQYPNAQKTVEYMSFNAPVGATEDEACGRAVFTGLHVSTTVEDRTEQPPGFPGLCTSSELSPEEKAVAFMLFDLSACIQNENKPPQIPK